MVRLGEPLSKEELENMIQDAKVDRDGRINYAGKTPVVIGSSGFQVVRPITELKAYVQQNDSIKISGANMVS